MTDGPLTLVLVLLILSFVASFGYMVRSRGVLGALFWTLMPMRLWASWSTGNDYNDSPLWLNLTQIALIAAYFGLRYFGK